MWFDTSDVSPMLVEKFPFDKYELEPSPLTQCILAKRNSNVCWQVRLNVGVAYGGSGNNYVELSFADLPVVRILS